MATKRVESLRSFVALDLNPMSLRRVTRVSDRLRMGSGAPRATWMPTAKLHITLKFMGELPAVAVEPLSNALGALVEGMAAPAPSPVRLDAFPSLKEARVIVVEVLDGEGAIAKLAGTIDNLAARHGVPLETRPFRPHVTLARLGRPYDASRWIRPLLAEDAGACQASSLTLYRSDVSDEGATYTSLARFELGRG